jgi:hypothetical protein
VTPAHKTLEGQITAVIVAACGVAVGLNPTNFPPKYAALIGIISAVALMVQRAYLSTISAATTVKVAAANTTVKVDGIANALTKHVVEADKIGVSAFERQASLVSTPQNVFMYDDVTIDLLPGDADAVAGYVDNTYGRVWKEDVERYPHLASQQRVLSIATETTSVARIMDIESGNPTTPEEGAAWVKKMHAHGVYRPGIYASESVMGEIVAALDRVGLARVDYVLWVADYNGLANALALLAKGYDACQFTDKADDRSLDESVCKADFFPPLRGTKPTPKPEPKPAPKPTPKPPAPKPVHPADKIAKAKVTFDYSKGEWDVLHDGDRITPEKTERRASALLQMNTQNGMWRVTPLPWDYEA